MPKTTQSNTSNINKKNTRTYKNTSDNIDLDEYNEKDEEFYENFEEGTSNSKSFIKIIYEGIVKVFGNENPFQLFALNWPGTILDPKILSWNQEAKDNVLPDDVLIETSKILDAFVPFSPITQTDGTRVSDRYISAIKKLGPIPNEHLLEMQELIRSTLNKEIIVYDGGNEVKTKPIDWFNKLYSIYIGKKKKWSEAILEEQKRLRELYPGDSNKQNDAYLKWYRINSDNYILEINNAYNILLTEFPLNEWETALSILDTSSSYSLKRAKELIRNIQINVPIEYGGGNYVPTFGIPKNWSNNLKTNVGQLDLLDTPQTKSMELSNSIRALQSELMAWSAIIPLIDDNDLKDSIKNFRKSLDKYESSRLDLITEYTNSVYVVGEAAAAYITSFSTEQEKFVTALTDSADRPQSIATNLANAANACWGTGGGEITYTKLLKLVEAITTNIDSIWIQHENTLTEGMNLAGAATKWLKTSGKQTNMQWIYNYIEQLEARLEGLRSSQNELLQSSMLLWKKMYNPNTQKYDTLTENSIPDTGAENIVPIANFNQVDQINKFCSPDFDTWTSIVLVIDKKNMESTERMSTYFSKRNWGVNFFFGSYGKQTQYSGSTFASEFMSDESEIKIGMLVKKVAIQRNWMDMSVLFSNKDFFRVTKSKYTLDMEKTKNDIINDTDLQMELLNKLFPCYPVSILIAKDVTIKMNFAFSKTDTIRAYAESISSSGGGFFLFNSNSVSNSSNSYEDVKVNVEAGEIEIKFESPQIIGYYLQLTPIDETKELDQDMINEILNANSFFNKLEKVHNDIKNL